MYRNVGYWAHEKLAVGWWIWSRNLYVILGHYPRDVITIDHMSFTAIFDVVILLLLLFTCSSTTRFCVCYKRRKPVVLWSLLLIYFWYLHFNMLLFWCSHTIDKPPWILFDLLTFSLTIVYRCNIVYQRGMPYNWIQLFLLIVYLSWRSGCNLQIVCFLVN